MENNLYLKEVTLSGYKSINEINIEFIVLRNSEKLLINDSDMKIEYELMTVAGKTKRNSSRI